MVWGKKSSKSSRSYSGMSSSRSDDGSSSKMDDDADDGKAHIEVCARIRPIAIKVERQGFFEGKKSVQPPPSNVRTPSKSRLKTPSKPGFFKRVVRKAPLPSHNQSQKSTNSDFVAWSVNAEGDTASQSPKTDLIQGRTHAYTLDRVYGSTSLTSEIYEHSIHKLVKDAMEGYHSSVLSYGQTSTGKTFTMSGTTESPGLIPLCMKDIFRYLDEISEEREYLIRLSYLEVYKEHIRDLLASTPQPIRLFENKVDGLVIRGLREEVVTRPDQVFALLKEGESRRQVGATNMNQHSSRSHTLVRLWIESHSPGSESRVSSLTLVDLAGSESVRLTGGARHDEGQYINKSLMTLGQVVLSLSEGAKGHIPYRDSKLTRLLQPSLSGNARMVLLCCIHPIASHLEESHNTFRFASRAKKIQQKAIINVTADEKTLLQNYREEIDNLKSQLQEARDQQRVLEEKAVSSSNVVHETNAEEASDEIEELVEAIMGMERLILKSRPGGPTVNPRTPERMESEINLLANDDDDDGGNDDEDLLGDLLSDAGTARPGKAVGSPSMQTPQKGDELQLELHRIRSLLGSVLQKRGVEPRPESASPAVAAATTPVSLEEKFDNASPASKGPGQNQEVQTLRQQLMEQEATTNLSKADSSFLQSQLREKDQLLEEVSKILEALELRQTVLERENVILRDEVTKLRRLARAEI